MIAMFSGVRFARFHRIFHVLRLRKRPFYFSPEQHQVIDDEYAYIGVKDPKVVITTGSDPSSRLMSFVKELRLLIPNSQRINRGMNYS